MKHNMMPSQNRQKGSITQIKLIYTQYLISVKCDILHVVEFINIIH